MDGSLTNSVFYLSLDDRKWFIPHLLNEAAFVFGHERLGAASQEGGSVPY